MEYPITLAGDSILHCRLNKSGLDTNLIADYLCLPFEQRCAKSGSTARDWAAPGNDLLRKALLAPRGICVLSLLANDAFAAINNDGRIDETEAFAAISAFGYVTRRLMEQHKRLVVVQYQDPYFGARPDTADGTARIDGAIAAAAPEGAELLDLRTILRSEHYDGNGIHPNFSGYEAMAKEIERLAAL